MRPRPRRGDDRPGPADPGRPGQDHHRPAAARAAGGGLRQRPQRRAGGPAGAVHGPGQRSLRQLRRAHADPAHQGDRGRPGRCGRHQRVRRGQRAPSSRSLAVRLVPAVPAGPGGPGAPGRRAAGGSGRGPGRPPERGPAKPRRPKPAQPQQSSSFFDQAPTWLSTMLVAVLGAAGVALFFGTVGTATPRLSDMNGLGMISILPATTVAGIALLGLAFVLALGMSRPRPLLLGALRGRHRHLPRRGDGRPRAGPPVPDRLLDRRLRRLHLPDRA